MTLPFSEPVKSLVFMDPGLLFEKHLLLTASILPTLSLLKFILSGPADPRFCNFLKSGLLEHVVQ